MLPPVGEEEEDSASSVGGINMIASSCPGRADKPIRVQPQRVGSLKSILKLAGWTLGDVQEVDPANLLEVMARVVEATVD